MRVSAEGWKISKKFTQSVVEAKEPTSSKEVRSFIGLGSWQRRFIHKFAQVAAQLNEILKQQFIKVKFDKLWGGEQNKAFLEIKKRLASTPILAHPHFLQPFRVYSDASKCAIGAVFCQKREGKEKPIAYFSRELAEVSENF